MALGQIGAVIGWGEGLSQGQREAHDPAAPAPALSPTLFSPTPREEHPSPGQAGEFLLFTPISPAWQPGQEAVHHSESFTAKMWPSPFPITGISFPAPGMQCVKMGAMGQRLAQLCSSAIKVWEVSV